ncbi:vomeronasal type-2 receptor 26-like [Latimeria chalumnae]|uniref:vomeronasal type-2 receptor 26-like n=1 Tax=Latimeria chalumnae TaxID=7897 RepID=UPI00313E7256
MYATPRQVGLCSVFLLTLSTAGYKTAQLGCRLPSLEVQGYVRDGDVIIGGTFPVRNKISSETSFTELPKVIRCESFRFRQYRWLQGMVFVIDEINQNSTECLKCSDDGWSNERGDQCIPKLINYLSYEEPMGTTLAVISISCALFPAVILHMCIKHRHTPLVKANNRELSYLLLFALVLAFLCSLIFIGQPRTWTCMMRQTAFGIIFALCVSCVLAKTIMVVIAFNATKPNSNLKKWVGSRLPNSIVFVCTVIQVIICITWLSSYPPFPEQDTKSQIGQIIIQCNEGSSTAFWCVLGYMGFLVIISFIVAFLARNLPDSFNEAKFITFSMLIFVSVWLAFIPAYLSTKGMYMVAVEIVAILASSIGLLARIFFPKCYIILLRPDMNTKEYLLGKGTFSMKNI